MNTDWPQDAVDWLNEHMAFTKWCWCGQSIGHLPEGSKCHFCGQGFNTQRLTKFELISRLMRRPVRAERKARRDRDVEIVFFGHWRYARSWPDRPTWNEMKQEHFDEALKRLRQ